VNTVDTFRIFLHVLAASVWVGGQIVLAGLVPTVREIDPEAPRKVARAFNRLAWPAYGVAVVTGVWNLLDIPMEDPPYVELGLKVLVVALSGIGAAVHQVARGNRAMLAIGGAMSSLFGIAAMWIGVDLPI
jgi:putative copper export protein